MKRLAFCTTLLAAVSFPMTSQAQPSERAHVNQDQFMMVPRPRPRPVKAEDQIKEDLGEFFDRLRIGDSVGTAQYIIDARYGWWGANEWMEYWSTEDRAEVLRLGDIKFDKIEGDNAQVTVSYRRFKLRPAAQPVREDNVQVGAPGQAQAAAVPIPDPGVPVVETLKLHRQGQTPDRIRAGWAGTWGIVTGAPETVLAELSYKPLTLQQIALFCKQPPGIVPYIRAWESRRRIGSLGLAVRQFQQDHEVVFAFDSIYLEAALRPYMVTTQYFTIPGTDEKYQFNSNLSNTADDGLEPHTTVMFYEGKDQQLDFRYNGKSAVCFADGHTELVDAERARSLRWKP
jgi:prepilin-type processing-associated H-X9-DG protein